MACTRSPCVFLVTCALFISAVFIAWNLTAGTATAQSESGLHEGTAGPYRLGVEVVPSVPRVGKVQFRVRPVLEATGMPVTDVQMEIYLGRDGREEIKTPALNSPADRTTYVGNAEVEQTGDWTVRVEVRSGEGTGNFAFAMPVRARVRSGKGLVEPTYVYLGAALVILGGVAWLIRSSRRARRQGGH